MGAVRILPRNAENFLTILSSRRIIKLGTIFFKKQLNAFVFRTKFSQICFTV
jgi:hypothetical protein